jgi:hypothetical protein
MNILRRIFGESKAELRKRFYEMMDFGHSSWHEYSDRYPDIKDAVMARRALRDEIVAFLDPEQCK